MMGTKGAAKTSELGDLHETLAKKLKELIVKGDTVTVGGKTKKVRVSAAVMAVARGFLKDNNIVCDEGLATRPVGELGAAVAEANEDEDVPEFVN
jgi:hypothetical protein